MTVDALSLASGIAASGLQVQSRRMLVASENLANAQSTASGPAGDPYRRKLVSFEAATERATGASSVRLSSVDTDRSPFPTEYDPGNVAADASGYVKLPNVNPMIELADMREAARSYEANLQVMKQARNLVSLTIDLLKSR